MTTTWTKSMRPPLLNFYSAYLPLMLATDSRPLSPRVQRRVRWAWVVNALLILASSMVWGPMTSGSLNRPW